MPRPRLILLGVLAAAIAGLYLANASWLARPQGRLSILAHRGVSQTFPPDGITNDTCTARLIRPPTHDYLENTLRSLRRAFDLGADMVELDVHPTTDGEFVVFHDWTLGCRTNGHGVTREHTLAQIQALDVGYGYTADGGRTYPFRGRGETAPSLGQVLAAFPDRGFLINVKSDDPAEGEQLAAYLAARSPGGLGRLAVIGGDRPVARLKARAPRLRAFSPSQAKDCLKGYLAWSWAGHTPAACRDSLVFAPQAQAWLLWGWPDRFLQRMHAAGSEVYIAGDLQLTGRRTLHGLDDPVRARRLPHEWRGGVSTDRVELIGPVLKPAG